MNPACLWVVLLILIVCPRNLSAADTTPARAWLHLNGYTKHFAASDANHELWGAGFTCYMRRFTRVLTAWEGDVFQDSGRRTSGYLGYSWTIQSELVNVGVTGAMMYHQNFKAQNRWRVMPVALPFIEIRASRIKARVYYIPPLRSKRDHQVALQLMIPISRWRVQSGTQD